VPRNPRTDSRVGTTAPPSAPNIEQPRRDGPRYTTRGSSFPSQPRPAMPQQPPRPAATPPSRPVMSQPRPVQSPPAQSARPAPAAGDRSPAPRPRGTRER
jgi:hypothetical protein